MRPILVPFFWLLERSYDIFFKWSDYRLSQEAERRLVLEIRATLSFLFDDYGGEIMSDDTLRNPRPSDYAVLVVSLTDFRLRFIRGRGELRAQVASIGKPHSWEDVQLVLATIDETFDRKQFSSLADIADALRPRIARRGFEWNALFATFVRTRTQESLQ
jgi:hypothetical protein